MPFPLRFKDPHTKEMLRLVADQLGVPMNDIAEEAVRQELILLGAGIEEQLSRILERLRDYNPQRDLAAHIDAYIEGEANPDPLQATQVRSTNPTPRRLTRKAPAPEGRHVDPRLAGALAAFKASR